MATALVTGASSGLGAEFARQLAARGEDLVLVARSREGLEQVAAGVRQAGVAAEVLVADLRVPADVERVAARLADAARPIDLLVNNAGYGMGRGFLESEVAEQHAALDVMVGALMALSHSAARGMVARGEGSIINVSSIAALLTGSTYNAHKAWVEVFTRGLANELVGTGVTATIVRPGLVRTEFQQRAGMNFSRLPGIVWLEAPPVVRAALRAARRGALIVTPSMRYRLGAGIARVLPRGLARRFSRVGRGR